MALAHSPSIVTSGLVLCLDAGNPRSYPGTGTSWRDASGIDNNSTLINGPTYNSANLGSLVFDGIDDYGTLINNSNSLAPTNVTIEAWARHTNASQTTSFIGGYGDTGYQGYWLGKSGGNWIFDIGVGGTTAKQLAGAVYQANVINQLVGTYNGSVLNFYTNGSLSSTDSTITGNISYSGVTPYIGQTTGLSAARYWTGNIYCYRIYNRALTAAEVLQNFNAARGRYGI